MYLQIIIVQGTNKIRLSNITLYDIYNQVIDIPKEAVTKQSSNYEEVPDEDDKISDFSRMS